MLDEQRATVGKQLLHVTKSNDLKDEKIRELSESPYAKAGKMEDEDEEELVRIMEGESENPFLPHQEALSRFSIMVSNDINHHCVGEFYGCFQLCRRGFYWNFQLCDS